MNYSPKDGSADGPFDSRKHDDVVVLEKDGVQKRYWSEIWAYRELFAILAWRDISARYKQSLMGISWGIVRPLLTMIIFSVVFGGLAKLPSEGAAPYSVLVMAGMLPWVLVSTVLGQSGNSLLANKDVVTKVYFPRLIVPSSSAVVAIVDFIIALLVMFVLMVIIGFLPDWRIVFMPLFAVLAVIVGIGPALLISSLNVKYRDLQFITPFIVQFGLYISPVGFSSNVVPDQWRLLYSINPVVGVVDGFRWCLLSGEADLYLPSVGISLFVASIFLIIGIRAFRAVEKTVVDVI